MALEKRMVFAAGRDLEATDEVPETVEEKDDKRKTPTSAEIIHD